MHMATDPIRTPIILEDNRTIEAVELNDGYDFIGFRLTYTDDIYKLIENNIKSKMFNAAKFYAWLAYNEPTPFFIKIKVLYGCMFAALLYSAEAWGDLSLVEKSLLATERKALKSILGIKSGTSNDIVYHEINQPDIIASIKDRQFKFAKKIKQLGPGEALMKEIWDMCVIDDEPTSMRHHYETAKDGNCAMNIDARKNRIINSDESMCDRYRSICGIEHNSILYQSCIDDTKRKTITRWRLSSHQLRIETGRYSRPYTEKKDRLCQICDVVEDESHALYDCRAHKFIRERYEQSINFTSRDIKQLLNPSTAAEITNVASFLDDIEENMKKLEMV